MAARYWAVIPAAGSGARMGGSIPKQYLSLAGHTVIEHVLGILEAEPHIAGITVAVAADDPYWQRYLLKPRKQPVRIASGGETRAHSVLNSLISLRDELKDDDWVLVHDAARPCLHPRDLSLVIQVLGGDPVGGILARPIADTLKRVNDEKQVTGTLDRSAVWRAFTPQMFRYKLLMSALEAAIRSGDIPTDEASAMERQRHEVRVVEGRSDNIKITRPDDILLAEAILAHRAGAGP
ncbi:MAG TPA: 2-C-methyl-D-erythritol 4-phosphate cytidylyltransferase [Gammaproteobacteria bacterium]|jgi:2-C-methyl-D-erythritol 4-phosphate cytidylyltransferase|nr:2-C-methyl-D-erythritol 4-phosphate cytidylyltransferase [Gammaproteobacteria bacterium]